MIRIAIDGPGGAGKSSVAKAVSKALGITCMVILGNCIGCCIRNCYESS